MNKSERVQTSQSDLKGTSRLSRDFFLLKYLFQFLFLSFRFEICSRLVSFGFRTVFACACLEVSRSFENTDPWHQQSKAEAHISGSRVLRDPLFTFSERSQLLLTVAKLTAGYSLSPA